jgi:cellulose biosynthesis protein BcsQ
MKITVMNFKGGVGKTSFSLNLALMMGCAIVTNDGFSPLERVISPKKILKLFPSDPMPKFPKNLELVFDLGGHIDPRTVDALKQSDVVVIPVFGDYLSTQTSLECISEVLPLHSNIVVVANRAEPGDYDKLKMVVGKFHPDLPVFPLNKSKAFENVFKKRRSLKDMAESGGLEGYSYRKVFLQFLDIVKHIEKTRKEAV